MASGDKDKDPHTRVGKKPIIVAGIFYKHETKGNVITQRRGLHNLLNTKSNIINTIVHEQFHSANHSKKIGSNIYKHFKVGIDDGDFAIISHLDAYEAQIKHESWKTVTKEYKEATIGFIKDFIVGKRRVWNGLIF